MLQCVFILEIIKKKMVFMSVSHLWLVVLLTNLAYHDLSKSIVTLMILKDVGIVYLIMYW